MIVDDTQPNLRLLCDILAGSEFQIRPFFKPALALESAFADPPNLLLLDIHMPDIDGYEFCRQILAHPVTKKVPVIFISAQKETESIVKCFKQGAVDYITKPFQPEEVLSRIQTHLKLQRFQNTLHQRNTELENAITELKNTQSQLIHAEKMASLGTLTAGIAHEINNPINFIQASANIISKRLVEIDDGKRTFDKDESRDWGELMEGFLDGSSRIAEIVQSLKTFARLDEDSLKEFDPEANIKATLRIFRHKISGGIKQETTITPPERGLYANAGKLNQVLSNLLSNAIAAVEANPSGKQKLISVVASPIRELDTSWYQISVSDTGMGIPAEALDRVFDPFYTTKPPGKGLGLGLSIASSIMEQHKGKLLVESSSKGTVFKLRLPA